jgi:hypothetical protein
VPGAVMVFPGDISAKFFIFSVLTGTIRPITVTATYGLSRTASYTIMPP